MKNSSFLIFFLTALFIFFPAVSYAKPPFWVTSRPVDHKFYVGIGMCEKKGNKKNFREKAKSSAFFDLASEISINVSGTFIQKTIERTGLSEDDIRLEIRSSSQARLKEHQLVDEWENRKEYWVYYRLSKERYNLLQQLDRQKAATAAADMFIKATEEKNSGNPVSALRFYFDALAKVQDFIGEHLKTNITGRSIFLFNEIYAGIQRIMADMELHADRSSVPALIGEPLHEPLAAVAAIKDISGEKTGISGLPVRFSLPWREGDPFTIATTDDEGIVRYSLTGITALDNGREVRASVDVRQLCPLKDTRAFFKAIMRKLTIPETSFVLKIFSDKDKYGWHREFDGRDIIVFSAYKTRESVVGWHKIHDELVNFIKGMGGRIHTAKNEVNLQNIIRWSADPDSEWDIDTETDAAFVIVMVASGKLNKRENVKNPFGEDVQFAGEIRTVVHKDGNPYFSDRYRGAGGWNPMGEDMCMDVLALHVFKRWKIKYLKHLGTYGQ